MTQQTPRIAVALSGGGYRAAAFSCGALLYLLDNGRCSDLAAVSSVSGGSITNAYFARNVMAKELDSIQEGAWRRVQWLLAFLARRDILSPSRMLIFALIASILVAALVFYSSASVDELGLRILLTAGAAVVAIVLVLIFLYWQLRLSMQFAIEWLLNLPKLATTGIGREKIVMRDIAAVYAPILCCTDLATGSHFYISGSFVAGVAPLPGDYSTLAQISGSAPELPLSVAVGASAAFPAVFRPTVVKADSMGLPVSRGVIDERLVLADGGLYDNFGVTVLDAWAGGRLNAVMQEELGPPPDALIVVDAGRPAYQRQRRHGLLRTVIRSMNVVHEANSAARRTEIRRQFDNGARLGCLVTISDDPYAIADNCPDPKVREAIRDWLQTYPARTRLSAAGWHALATQQNPSVTTNLKRLGPERVADLVLHGYVAMMARSAAHLGWSPTAPNREIDSLEEICSTPFVGNLLHRLLHLITGRSNWRTGVSGEKSSRLQRIFEILVALVGVALVLAVLAAIPIGLWFGSSAIVFGLIGMSGAGAYAIVIVISIVIPLGVIAAGVFLAD